MDTWGTGLGVRDWGLGKNWDMARARPALGYPYKGAAPCLNTGFS